MRHVLVLLALGALAAVAATDARAQAVPCSASPFTVVALQADGPMPATATVEAGKELDFLNQTDVALTVTSSGLPLGATLQPGECIGVLAGVGEYPYSVSGYAAGDAAGWVHVAPAPTVTISQHASIAYGQRTLLSGTAVGTPGTPVVVWARPLSAQARTQIGTVVPVDGIWSLSVAPKVGTEYTAGFADAQDQRVLRVRPNLVVRKKGHTITISVAARLFRPTLWLFRYTPAAEMVWTGVRSTTATSAGGATFKNVPAGRYYVAVLGGSLYLDNATEPFQIRR